MIYFLDSIRDELVNAAEAGITADMIFSMKETDQLKSILPEVHAMIDVAQPVEFHAEGDVFTHTILTLRNAKVGVIPQLAALLHDVGKPSCRVVTETGVHFYEHDCVGARMAETLLKRLKFDGETISTIKTLIGAHMRTFGVEGGRSARRFVRDMGELKDALLDLSEADEKGSLPLKDEMTKVRELVAAALVIPVRKLPMLNGTEIMAILGVKPGPIVGEVGKFLLELEDDMAAEGRVMTHDYAIAATEIRFLSR